MSPRVVSTETCQLCGSVSDFLIEAGATLLREAQCSACGATIRNSDVARTVAGVVLGSPQPLRPALPALHESGVRILEAQASGAIHQVLRELPGYACFELLDGVPPGEEQAGVRCDDLQCLSFPDGSFDVVITQDVLEHVARPGEALAEINRVLRPGGTHIFTVPWHEGGPTRSREGRPQVHHRDGLRRGGSLVRTDWGVDLREIVDRHGMRTEALPLHRFFEPAEVTDPDSVAPAAAAADPLSSFRYNSVVFVSRKIRDHEPRVPRPARLELLRLGPDSVQAGAGFNVQPGGMSALWAEGRPLGADTAIVIDGVELDSRHDPRSGVVTALVPGWMFRAPRSLPVRLRDLATGAVSNAVAWTVTEAPGRLGAGQTASLENEIYDVRREMALLRAELARALPPTDRPEGDGTAR